jgi:SOS-response transcriptional repressor LexA
MKNFVELQRGRIAQQYAGEILLVAAAKAEGYSPLSLRADGKLESANALSQAIDALNAQGLMHLADAKVKEIQNLNVQPTQTDFLNEVEPGQKPTPMNLPAFFPKPEEPPIKHWVQTELSTPAEVQPIKRVRRKPRKYHMPEDLHKESKFTATPRSKLHLAEANRQYQLLLKRMGWTGAAETQDIQEAAEEAIRRLRHAGVWHYFENGHSITIQEQKIIQQALKDDAPVFETIRAEEKLYEKTGFSGHKDGSYQDLDSSEGVTIFASPEEWNKAHA